MVAIDYSYKDSDYYKLWYKQGIVPEDKLFAAYNGITNILGTVGSIFSSLKSSGDDDDGKGGGGLNGTVKDASQEEFDEKAQTKKRESEFIKAYNACKNKQTPDDSLVKLAKAVVDDKNTNGNIKAKACQILANDNNTTKLSIIDTNPHIPTTSANDGDAGTRQNNPFGSSNDVA